MNKYKAIIFDLDGTLLDTIEDLSDSMNEVLKFYGYPIFTNDEYKLKVGGGFKGLVSSSLPENSDIARLEEATKMFSEIYDSKYTNKTKVYQGIDDMLDQLNEIGLKLAINSNKRDHYTKILSDKFFKRIPFVSVYGDRERVSRKPDPASALEIIESMDFKPQEVLFVGDSKVDIMTAKNAGLDSVGVLWGFRSYEELTSYGANYIVSEPEDIINIIKD